MEHQVLAHLVSEDGEIGLITCTTSRDRDARISC